MMATLPLFQTPMHEISRTIAMYMYDTIMGDTLDMNSSCKNSKGRFWAEFYGDLNHAM
jgi:hypothetical protein